MEFTKSCLRVWLGSLFAVLVFFTGTGFAFDKGLFVGGGASLYNLNKTSGDAKASPAAVGSLFLPLGLRYSFASSGGFQFAPGFALSHITGALRPVKAQDGGVVRDILLLDFPGVWSFSGWYFLSGPGLSFYQLKGNPGEMQQLSGTALNTYYLPTKTVTSRNMTWMLGVGGGSSSIVGQVDLVVLGLGSGLGSGFLSGANSKKWSLALNFSLLFKVGG